MIADSVQAALDAEQAFRATLSRVLAAATAIGHGTGGADVVEALTNAHAELVASEREVMERRRAAFHPVTPSGVLDLACRSVGVLRPKAPVPEENEAWAEAVINRIPLEKRPHLSRLVNEARRLAEADRLLSAEFVLEKLKAACPELADPTNV